MKATTFILFILAFCLTLSAQGRLQIQDSTIIAGDPFEAILMYPKSKSPITDSSALGGLQILRFGESKSRGDSIEQPLLLVAVDTARVVWDSSRNNAFVLVKGISTESLEYGDIRYLYGKESPFHLPWWAYALFALLLLALFFYLRYRNRQPRLLNEEKLGDKETWMKAALELKQQKDRGQLNSKLAAENSMILLRSLLRIHQTEVKDKTGLEILKIARHKWPELENKFATVVNYCYRILFSGTDPGPDQMDEAIDQLPHLGRDVFARKTDET